MIRNMMKCGFIMAAIVLATMPANAGIDDSSWRGGPSKEWFVNWDKAWMEAKKTGKKIFVLMLSSGGVMKKLKSNVLDNKKFIAEAKKNLVLLYLRTPYYLCCDKMCEEQSAHNYGVAYALNFNRRYDLDLAMILTCDGKMLGTISGAGKRINEYLCELRTIMHNKGKNVGPNADVLFSPNGYLKLLNMHQRSEFLSELDVHKKCQAPNRYLLFLTRQRGDSP